MDRSGEEFDVIIVGGGIIGSCTAYEVAKRGYKVILLEQFDFLHHCGSSHGGSRNIRVTYPENYYGPMVVESWRLWEAAEAEAGYTVVTRTPHLDMGHADDDSLKALVSNCLSNSIPHEMLDHQSLPNHFSGLFRLPEGSIGVCTEMGGIIKATKAVSMFQALALKRGAVLQDQSEVESIERDEERGCVKAVVKAGLKIRGKKCVITAGAWTGALIKKMSGWDPPITPLQTSLLYWRIKEGCVSRFSPGGGFPSFARYGKSYLYGSPSVEFPGLIKIAVHGGSLCEPNKRDWTPDSELVLKELSSWIEETFSGLVESSHPVITQSCLYSMTPDEDYIIDYLGGDFGNDIILGCGFSGHGFKMGPLMGDILADLATCDTTSRFDLRPFRIARFLDNPKGNVKDAFHCHRGNF